MPATNLHPGTAIKLSKEKSKRLAGALCEIIEDLESQNKTYFDNIRIWWDNYNAVPRVKTKNFPFKGASNVIVPLCKSMVDASVSRTLSKVFPSTKRIWAISSENETLDSSILQVSKYINWQATGGDFSLKDAVWPWLEEMAVVGSSVIAGNYRTDVRNIFIPPIAGQDGPNKPQLITYAEGPLLEHVPREYMLWDTNHRIQDAAVVCREYSLSWAELAQKAHMSKHAALTTGWDTAAVEHSKPHGGAPGISRAIKESKDRADYRDPPAYLTDNTHAVYEVHVDWPMLNAIGINGEDLATPDNVKIDTIQIPLVATLHRNAKMILRLTGEPYAAPYKPFFDGYHHRRPGRGASVGLVKELEGMQSAMTTIFNQQIDAQTRANSVWAKTGDSKHLQQPIDPQVPIYDPGNTFVPLALPGSQFSNIQLTQQVQAMAERLSGQSDPAFGRETRLGGHSAPAATTNMLLQQGQILASPQYGALNQTISQMGEFITILNQQFRDTSGKIERVLGKLDGEKVNQLLFPSGPIPGQFTFNVQGLSADDTQEALLNQAVITSDLDSKYWGEVFTAVESLFKAKQAAAQAQDPGLGELALESFRTFIKSKTAQHRRVLDAAGVDDVESHTLTLEQGRLGQLLAAIGQNPGGPGQPGQGNGGQPGMAPPQRGLNRGASAAFR